MWEGTGATALSARQPHRSQATTGPRPSRPRTASLDWLCSLEQPKPAVPSRTRPYAHRPGDMSVLRAAEAASASRKFVQCHPSQLSRPVWRLAALRPDSSLPCPRSSDPVPLHRWVSPARASAGRCVRGQHSLLEQARLCVFPRGRFAHLHRSSRAESPSVSHSCCLCTDNR